MAHLTAKEPSLSEAENLLGGLSLDTLPRLAILAGPAGIGKTRFCLANFIRLLHKSPRSFDRDLLYLLPTAEHRERVIDLILRKEKTGFLGERVTTLNRLMRELLKAGEWRLATDVERRFLLDEIIKEKGGNYFASVMAFSGFIDRVSRLLGELKESMVSLGAFREGVRRLKKAQPEMSEKYEGLLRIYETYEVKLESLGLRDHRDGFFLLKEILRQKKAKIPPFRHLFVDGFFDFSGLQFEFLRWLTEHSERVVLTFTLDLSEERKDLFEIPLQTLKELEKLGFQTVDLGGKKNHRTSSGALCHAERNLFSASHAVIASPESLPAGQAGAKQSLSTEIASASPRNDEITILEATGIRGEIEMIAREIRRLVRTEGLHFSDIAVILRRIGDHQEIFRSVFREFDIPAEIHERERLRDTPMARTLVSFFKILLEDWRREDLLNFLKSSYVERDYAEVCSVEIQSFDRGIAAGRERWLKEIPNPLFEKLNAFHDRSREARTVNEWIRLTQEAIESFGLARVDVRYEEKVRRDFASLKRLKGLLEEIRHADVSRGSQKRSFEAFAKEFLGLIEIDLFSLHERDKNRVQVYDVSLARQKEYKVVFLAGLLEKTFPMEIREEPILSDQERRTVGLQEKLPRQALERYLFYVGFTRAREKVILSYPRFDLEGREVLPSFYVDEVTRLFRDEIPRRLYPVNQPLPRLEDAVEEREVEAHLVERLFDRNRSRDREENLLTLSLYNRFLERPSFQVLLRRVLFDPVPLIQDQKVRASFSPTDGIFHPTGLEIYGRCPYRYFSSRVLKLQEIQEGIDAKQVGDLLHRALEIYWRERVEKGRKELAETDRAKAFVVESLHELLRKEPLRGERAYRIELKKAQMEAWLSRMVEKEIEEGGPVEPLQPRHFELKFGFKGGKIAPLLLYDSHREDLKLRGKIDRIDIDPTGNFGVVIDYKTGGTFKNKDLEFGTALQLPLYLLVLQKLLKLRPVGGEIYQIKEAKSSGFYAQEGIRATQAEVHSQSIFDPKAFDQVLERAVRFSFKFAEGIRRAEIPVQPRDCDKHCPFPSICRIEKWRLPFIYQEIREEDHNSGMA